MAELLIRFCDRQRTPTAPGGRDGYRWHVGVEEDGQEQLLVVDLSDSHAVETGLGTTGLDEAFPVALQRYARGRLKGGEPILDQVADWNSPIRLAPEHFR